MNSECEIQGKGATPTCAACNGNHTAWNRSCPERRKQWERARQAYANRPRRFNCEPLRMQPQPGQKRARRDSSPPVSPAPPASSAPPRVSAPAPAPSVKPVKKKGPGKLKSQLTADPDNQLIDNWLPQRVNQDSMQE